tara:strand:- start:586 stop:822 length:237 start_codon:yes stop_codon:yes gene_type:complete
MRITKKRLKEIIKEELRVMEIDELKEGNFQDEYCSKNPEAEGCLEYWQEEATSQGITPEEANFDDAMSLIAAIDKLGN